MFAASLAILWSPSDIWNNAGFLEFASGLSTLVLIIGAVVEEWPKLQQIGLLTAKLIAFRSTPFERCVLKKLVLRSVGAILVVAGIAGELIFETRTFIVEDKQQAAAESTIAGLKAATAKDELEAARLRKDSEQLKKDAEDEHTARVTIEAKVAWRRLDDKEKSDLASNLGNIPPNSEGASFWTLAGDAEAGTFAVDLAEAIKRTGIVVQPPGEIVSMRSAGKFGDPIKPFDFGVSVISTKDETSRSLAEHLIKELNNRGFDAYRQKDPAFKDSSVPQIEVFVHSRPQGPQGEFKLQAEREAKAKKTIGASH